MINFHDVTNKNKTEHNPKLPHIPDHLYRIMIIGGSGSEKINILLNLKNYQDDDDNVIDKIYLYAKDPYEAKYQFLIKKHEKSNLDNFNDPKDFIEYTNDVQDVYKNIEEYNPGKKHKILIVFDDMIADMVSNKNFNSIVTELR